MVKIKRHFKVANIKCDGCANRVKKALADDFEEVLVDLTKEPRVVSIETCENFNESAFRKKMKDMGYPLTDEELGGLEKVGIKAKSFVSCAIGKMDKS